MAMRLDNVRTGSMLLQKLFEIDLARDAKYIRTWAMELERDAGPADLRSIQAAARWLLSINWEIEKSWGELGDALNLARSLVMRAQIQLTVENFKDAWTAINNAIYLLEEFCRSSINETAMLIYSEALRVKIRVASMSAAMDVVTEEKRQLESLSAQLGKPSVQEKVDREIVIFHNGFIFSHRYSARVQRAHFDEAEPLWSHAQQQFAQLDIKPQLAIAGFLFAHAERNFISRVVVGSKAKFADGLEVIHERLLPLLMKQPDYVHLQNLDLLRARFDLDLQMPGAAIWSPTLPRLLEDSLGLAPAK
ncbi:MAG: hypothetical protein WD688_18045 [Candidatus Binatia bacterium]